jgi:rare lipoprotein A
MSQSRLLVLCLPLVAFAIFSTHITNARAESGLASYYEGVGGHAGEMTCAHKSRRMGSMVTVSYRGRTIRCRVTDRGPFIKGRVIDVSTSAARALGMMSAGVVMVSLE